MYHYLIFDLFPMKIYLEAISQQALLGKLMFNCSQTSRQGTSPNAAVHD